MPDLRLSRPLLAAALMMPLMPAAAFAAAATASQTVNVRSGPATSYQVVGQLQGGDPVDVRQCEGSFCQVSFAGGSGWVSASFLTRGDAPPAAPRIAASSGSAAYPPAYAGAPAPPHGPVVAAPVPKADVPDAPPAPIDEMATADGDGWGPPPDMPDHFGRRFARQGGGPATACFLDSDGGDGFCLREGEQRNDLADWSGRPLMLRDPSGLNVTVCTARGYQHCRTYMASGPVLVGIDNRIETVSVAAPGY